MFKLIMTVALIAGFSSISAAKKSEEATREPASTVITELADTYRVIPGQIASLTKFSSGDGLFTGRIIEHVTGGAWTPSALLVCAIHTQNESIMGDDTVSDKCYDIGRFTGEPTKVSVRTYKGAYMVTFEAGVYDADTERSAPARVAVRFQYDGNKSLKSTVQIVKRK